MATVYEATNDIGHQFAIKVLKEGASLEWKAARRFLKEAVLSNAVRHDSVVQVIDHGVTDDGCTYFVMPLIDGETVAARANKNGGTLWWGGFWFRWGGKPPKSSKSSVGAVGIEPTTSTV